MLEYPHTHDKPMINLDERYHSYLNGSKKMRIDGIEEKVVNYGYNCNGSDITGYYIITENYKLYYNMKAQFLKMENLKVTA